MAPCGVILACVGCNGDGLRRHLEAGARRHEESSDRAAACDRAPGVKFASMFLVPSCNHRRGRTTALANVHSCFAKLLFKTARRGTLLRPTCSLRAGDNECRSYAMANRMVEPALVLGLVSALALSTAAPSFGQTQRQRPSAQEQGLGQGPGPASPADETFGQAPPRAQSRNPAAAQQSGSCWIPTNEDFGVGYWGPCSNKGSRPVK